MKKTNNKLQGTTNPLLLLSFIADSSSVASLKSLQGLAAPELRRFASIRKNAMDDLDDVVKELDRAMNNQEFDAVLDSYEEEAILVMEPGRIARGKSEISDFYKYIFQMDIKASQLTTNMLESGNIALFTSKWVAEGQTQNGEKFSNENIATSVFRKGSDGKWRLVIDNSFGPEVLKVNNA